MTIAEQLATRSSSSPNVEAVAMALAETGRFDQAIALQEQLITAVRRARRPDLEERFELTLEEYRRGRPCRSPW
jgi:hypothetical protein